MGMPITEQIREALRNSSVTRYRISKDLGVSQAQLSKFVHGKMGLSLDVLDRLADYLGLEIRPKAERAAGRAAGQKPQPKKRGR